LRAIVPVTNIATAQHRFRPQTFGIAAEELLGI